MDDIKPAYVVACVIARGIEETLPDCIRSIKSSGVDFLNITLNQERKREFIEDTCKEVDLPYKITEFKWTDDFAACRTFNLEQRPKEADWIIWLDSDDVIKGDVKEAIKEAKDAEVIWLWYYYSHDEFDNPTNLFIRERIIKTTCFPVIHWQGIVHEVLIGAENFKSVTLETVSLKHNHAEVEDRGQRLERLLTKAMEKGDDVRLKMYMAHHWSARHELRKAIEWYKKFVDDPRSHPIERWQALCYLASGYRYLGDYNTAISYAFKAIELLPAWQDAYIELAIDYHFLDDPERCLHWASEAKNKSKGSDLIFFNPLFATKDLNVFTTLALSATGHFYDALRFIKEAKAVAPEPAIEDIERKVKECILRQEATNGIKTLCTALLKHGEFSKLDAVKNILPWWLSEEEYSGISKGIDKFTVLLDPEKYRTWYQSLDFFEDDMWCKPDHPRYQYQIKRIKELGAKKILDIGCGPGVLLGQLKDAGYEVFGIEPSKSACKRLEEKGIPHWEGFFEDYQGKEVYDVAIQSEYLEHVHDPQAHFDKALDMAHRLLITVPHPIVGSTLGLLNEGENPPYLEHLRVVTEEDVDELVAALPGRRPENMFTMAGNTTDLEYLMAEISHRLWSKNEKFIKLFSAACSEDWNPHGNVPGGSELAIREVTKELDKLGNLVFVYYEGSKRVVYEGVVYRPFRFYDPGVACHVFISNRVPQIFEQPVLAEQSYLWAHDVNYGNTYTKEVEEKINGVFLDSEWHKKKWQEAYPFSKKLHVTGEGIQTKLFENWNEKPKTKHKFIYASAPNRGLISLLEMWKDIKTKMPDATLDIYYGWEWWDKWNGETKFPELKKQVIELCGQEGITWKGHASNEQIAEALKDAEVWLYPAEFEEIYCQIAVEAMAAGCICFYSPVGALPETIGNKGVPLPMSFGKIDKRRAVRLLNKVMSDKVQVEELQTKAHNWAMKQDWSLVAKKFYDIIKNNEQSTALDKTD